MESLRVRHMEIVDVVDGPSEGVEITVEVNAWQVSCRIQGLQERI